MTAPVPLPRAFYARPTLTVARDLLGMQLCRQLPAELGGELLRARIVETEAYDGPDDTACHGAKGLTPRTRTLFGPPGHAYVYLIYGMYDLFNIVTDRTDYPAGVLIRAVEPLQGETAMRRQRPNARHHQLSNGPGKLTRALAISRQHNDHDLTLGQTLWISQDPDFTPTHISCGPRIGIDYADDAHRLAPWRCWLSHNPWVSRP